MDVQSSCVSAGGTICPKYNHSANVGSKSAPSVDDLVPGKSTVYDSQLLDTHRTISLVSYRHDMEEEETFGHIGGLYPQITDRGQSRGSTAERC